MRTKKELLIANLPNFFINNGIRETKALKRLYVEMIEKRDASTGEDFRVFEKSLFAAEQSAEVSLTKAEDELWAYIRSKNYHTSVDDEICNRLESARKKAVAAYHKAGAKYGAAINVNIMYM